MAGLFFCLASAEGAGVLFCPVAIQPHTSVYSVFFAINAIIPPTPQNGAHGFTGAFPAIAPIQPPTIPDRHKRPLYHLRHAGAHTRARAPSTDTRYHRHAGTLYGSAQPPYYNKVYNGAAVRPLSWIHARRCSISQTIQARRGLDASHVWRLGLAPGQRSGRAFWHPPPGGAVQRQGGRRGTIGGCRRISFRAFAR